MRSIYSNARKIIFHEDYNKMFPSLRLENFVSYKQ